jgi:molybdopterin converting factor subunit 1
MKVLLFARARDLAGTETIHIELPPGATVADLRRALAARYPELTALLARCAVAVDSEFVTDVDVLAPTAVAALLPPVSGG